MNFFAWRRARFRSFALDAADVLHFKRYHKNGLDVTHGSCKYVLPVLKAFFGGGEPTTEARECVAKECRNVESAYTNSDGTKKPGWMKAPNGEPSNLPECLWLLVRTPSFMKWFGNWELRGLRFDVLPLAPAEFQNQEEGVEWAEANGVIRTLTDEQTGGKGAIWISKASVDKMLHGSAMRKSANRAAHLAVLTRLAEVIRLSHICETHPDFKKKDGARSPENGINPNVEISVMYGAVSFGGKPYRVKTTLKRHLDNDEPTKAYSYEISNIEILPGTAEPVALPNGNISMSADIVLKNVVDVYGEKLLDFKRPLDANGEPII